MAWVAGLGHAERAAAVEAVPAEPQDDGAEHDEGNLAARLLMRGEASSLMRKNCNPATEHRKSF